MFENHTYSIERNGKLHHEHEDRIKLFHPTRQDWGKATSAGEAVRQPTRSGYRSKKPAQGIPSIEETEKSNEVTDKEVVSTREDNHSQTTPPREDNYEDNSDDGQVY